MQTIIAFVLVFPPTDENDHYYILSYFWLPEETLDRAIRCGNDTGHSIYDELDLLVL